MKILIISMLLSLVAHGVEPVKGNVDEAKKHSQRSRELYEDGDMAGALNELSRSYAIIPNYKLLYNMGQIQAQQLNHAGALKSFQDFLKEGGVEIPEARRLEVQKEIEKLRTRVGQIEIVVNVSGAEISVDEVVVGVSPLAFPVVVNGGKRKVSVSLQNHFPQSKIVDVLGLETAKVQLELQSIATVAPEKQPVSVIEDAKPKTPAFPIWIPWAATGALAVGTVVSGIVTLGAQTKQKQLIETFGISADQQSAAQAATRTGALVTDILGAATIAAGIGSLIYTVTRGSDAAPQTITSLGIDGNGIVVTGAF
jgi:PEGA domain